MFLLSPPPPPIRPLQEMGRFFGGGRACLFCPARPFGQGNRRGGDRLSSELEVGERVGSEKKVSCFLLSPVAVSLKETVQFGGKEKHPPRAKGASKRVEGKNPPYSSPPSAPSTTTAKRGGKWLRMGFRRKGERVWKV